ncbi:MAG: hypothetical protein DHS20C18_26470 [Saprospiraceae bacterium]|nr:MAG: hypothetical protein DHS20C18_26470 [Saprospiraceae bacterium]
MPLKMFLSALMFLLIMPGIHAQNIQFGEATYYSDAFQGKKTSSGERYDKKKFTAAHRTYPHGTILRVTRTDTNQSVDVKVNDCGPHTKSRIIDLSRAAAEKINLVNDGIAYVQLEVVKMGRGRAPCGTRASDIPASYDNTSGEGVTIKGTPSAPSQGTFRLDALNPIQKGFAVQVASFRHFDYANNKANELKGKGFQNVLISMQGNVHKVVIGPFNTRDEAKVYQGNLKRKYKMNGFIISLE